MSSWFERALRLAWLAAPLLLAGCGDLATPDPERGRHAFRGPLRTTRIILPADDAQFMGPGAELLNRNCLACHSPTMIVHQPRLTPSQWRDIVEKMRKAYHAPIADEDIPELVQHLVSSRR